MSNPEDWKKWEGRVDGKFPLRQWLGGSEHSAVFLTERPGQSEKVAIKLIAADADADRQLAHWRAAAQLSHPHLMRIYEAGRCRLDGTPLLYCVMEYAEEDLSQILPQRALAPSEVTDLLPPLLDALSFLHGKGFVHGRVKPSNVHAMGDQLKLSADQIVATTEPASRRRDVYDAPETAAGIVSPAGDVWSIGVTLVAALTQNVSFEGSAEANLSHPDPAPPDTVPQPFRGIARECLHLDPKRRCSLAEIQARLQPAGRSVPAPAPIQETPAPAYGTAWRVVIPVAVLLLFVLGLFFYRTIFPPKAATQLGPVKIDDAAPATAAEPVRATPTTSNPTTSNPTSHPTTAKPAAPSPAPAPVPPPSRAAATRGEVVHQVLPEVPQSARNTITGTVKVSVQVDVDSSGKVTAAKFKSSGPSKYFAGLAMKAAERWEFSAPVIDGKTTNSSWVLQFRFKRTSTQASPERVKR
jgi:TonB family protein